METSKKQELFQKYVSGQASDKEVDLLMHLIAEGGTDDLGDLVDGLWSENHLFPSIDEGVAGRMKAVVMKSVGVDATEKVSRLKKEPSYWLRVAAVLLPLTVIGALFYLTNRAPDQVPAVSQAESSANVEKVNPKGQKSTFILFDGSMVTLNADSKLTYKEGFAEKERRVTLIGEAFFDVAKDSLRPFIIQTEQITTRVLGTSFNVRAYPGAEEVTVSVATGQVSVQKSEQSSKTVEEVALLLLPGEMGVYKKQNQSLNKASFDVRDSFGWKHGLLYFKNAPFEQVLHRLEQWYGVTIVVKKKIALENDFSGAYRNKPLELVLEGLSFVYDFKYEIDGKEVTIR
ncbi:MAG: DUF4974 domain-containing protein [Imperialibacter sp.]|uniref:FecR family protein n=1 Tax=Imperialibacter sp. TaxID=2038411 RepID=UPI0032EC7BF7